MATGSAIILSNDEQTVSVCSGCLKEIGTELVVSYEFDSLILALQENDYNVVICDCSNNFEKCLQWVKIIKKMRPKVALIVISQEIKKNTGGVLYQEGIFHLSEKPLDKEYLREILEAIVIPRKRKCK